MMRPLLASLVLTLALGACARPRDVSGSLDGGPETGGSGGGQGGGGGQGPDAAQDAASSDRPKKRCGAGATVGFGTHEFKDPVVQCHWPGLNVMSTPLVADLNGDGKPEIVFPAFDYKVHAISGSDCKEVWTSVKLPLCHLCDLALGDLDGDGDIEVVTVTDGGGLAVLDGKDGTIVAQIKDTGWQQYGWVALAIANVDGVGPAEILVGSAAFRLEGGALKMLWANKEGGSVVSVADLDEDGVMEMVTDYRVLDALTGAVKLTLPRSGGYTAVTDFDPSSPGPEIVFVDHGSGEVLVVAGLTAPKPGLVLFGPYWTDGMGKSGFAGGAPAVADFDGDGAPEFGIASGDHYTVFDRECAATPKPDKCLAPGILWQSNSQDQSSGSTTSTVFDFNCDEKPEVVYRDECWLRVYDGPTGKVLFASAMTSNTAIEGAVVADTDGTGHAKIVVSTNDIPKCPDVGVPEEYTGTPFTGKVTGVFVLKDPDDRWSPTRRIWNQNSYHVTNVNDDGTIPLKEQPVWKGENTWRANVVLPP